MPISRVRVLGFRVRIWDDADEPVDVTSFVRSARWGLGDVSAVGTGALGVDATVATANVTLLRDESLVELFRDYARIVIEGRATPRGSTPGPLEVLFDGFLGDGFRWTGSNIELTARDPAKLLQDTQLDNITSYGSEAGTPAEVVIQQIMTQNLGALAPTLYVPVPTGALVREYLPRDQSVWDASQGVVARFGWYLGYVRSDGQYRLTLMEPPRGSVPPPNQFVLGSDDLIAEDLDWSTRDVRNSVTIEYTDEATGEIERLTVRDEDSILNVTGGVPKHSHITLAGDSGVNTLAEAQRLAEAFLADLSTALSNIQVTIPFSLEPTLFTELIVNNQVRGGGPETYSVNSVEHEVNADGRYRTTVLASGQVRGGLRKWLDKEPRPGSPGDPGTHVTQLRAPTLSAVTAPPGVFVRATNGSPDAVALELHASMTPGFTPDSGSFVIQGPSNMWALSTLTPGETWYFRAREIDARGGTGPWSAEASALSGTINTEIDPDILADIAYSKAHAAVVEAGAQTWTDISQLVTDQQALWDAGGKQTDGLLLTGTVTARTSTTVTQGGRDWAGEGIQPGDQLRFYATGALKGHVFAVTDVDGATLTVTPAMTPLPDVGMDFQVGRTARVTAIGITETDTELRSEIGAIEDDLDGDAFDSKYSSVRQTAELAQSGLTRQESTLMLTGETTDGGTSTVTDANYNFETAGILAGDVVYISDGPHAGISRPVASVDGSVITLAEPFPVTIPSGTEYRVGRVNAVYGSAVTQTADEWRSVVGTLNEDLDYVGQYSSIQQLKDRILQVVGDVDALEGLVDALDATGSLEPMTTVNGISMTTVGGVDMTTSVERGLSAVFTAIAQTQNQIDTVASQTTTHYSLITQNADAITQRVRNGVFTSTITQLSNNIDLKVNADGVISSINVSPESIRLDSDRIHLAGDTTVAGSFTVGGSSGNVAINNGAVTASKIGAGAVTADKIEAGAVTADKIEAGAITTEKLAAAEINLSTTGRATAKLTVRDTNGVRRAQYGRLTTNEYNTVPLPGVPDRNRYGLWLDANEIWIPGAGLVRDTRAGMVTWTHTRTIQGNIPSTQSARWIELPEGMAEILYSPAINRPMYATFVSNAIFQSITIDTQHDDPTGGIADTLAAARTQVLFRGASRARPRQNGAWAGYVFPPSGQPGFTGVHTNPNYTSVDGLRWYTRPEIFSPRLGPPANTAWTVTHTVTLLWQSVTNDMT